MRGLLVDSWMGTRKIKPWLDTWNLQPIPYSLKGVSQVALVVKNSPANAGGHKRCRFNLLEEGTAIHSSTVAWRIPRTEEPGTLWSIGLQRVGHDWRDLAYTHQCERLRFDPWVGKIPWRRKWQPTPVFLPGKSHGQRSLEGYSPGGCKRVRRDFTTEQQQHRNNCLKKALEEMFRAGGKYDCVEA